MRCVMTDCPNEALPDRSLCQRCRDRKAHYEKTDKFKKRRAAYRQQIKLAVFEKYGGARCACCAEERLEFLSIDHINGGGAKHREQITGDRRNGSNLYFWLRTQGFPPGFRVLCMNCNFAIGHFGYCPHERETLKVAGI